MAKQEWRRLPDGTATKSAKMYVKEWYALMDPICKLMNWTVWGFDPTINFRTGGGGSYEIPIDFARKVCGLIAACEDVVRDCVENPYGNWEPAPTNETMRAIRRALKPLP